MPYASSHASRQHPPAGYDRFTRGHPKGWPKGVDAVYGIKGTTSEIQSVRFDAKLWTVERAKEWLKKHGFKTNLEAAKAAPVKKSTVTITVTISKLNDEKQLIYGPALIPNVLDRQKDIITSAEIEKAAHDFLARYNSGTRLGDMHKDYTPGKLALVESWLVPEGNVVTLGSKTYDPGTWLLTIKVLDATLWADVKSGKRKGLSVKGKSKAQPLTEPQVAELEQKETP